MKQVAVQERLVHVDRISHSPLMRWMRLAPPLCYVALFPWLIVVVCDLACKAQWLNNGGYAMAASAMNRPYESSQSFSDLEHLAFFSHDLLFTCLFIPVLLLIVAKWLRPAWSTFWIVLLSLASSAIVLTQYSAFSMTGRFATWGILRTGLDWWYENPGAGHDALVRSFEMRVGAAALLVIGLGTASFVLMRGIHPGLTKAIARVFQIAAMVCLLMALITYHAASQIPAFADDMLVQTTQSLLDDSASGLDTQIFSISPERQYALYRQLANTPGKQGVPDYSGRAAGFNVLIFVFETTPARILNPATETLEEFPNLRHLRERSLVAAQHFTTVPATDLASFAMFASMYTNKNMGGSVSRRLPGLMQVLDSAGYETGFYGYMWKGNGDDSLLRNLGFRKLVNSDFGSTFFARLQEESLTLETRIARDIGPLKRLKEDIAHWAANKQKFAAVFFPQMGHGPWPAIPGNPASIADERSRFLAKYQDAWIGELVSQLEVCGELDHTIIVVTADHGFRFRSESLDLPIGKIDDLSYHVPLVVFVPKLLNHQRIIPWPTSHIDIQPTVLDLLGIQGDRQWEQGTAIWNPLLSERRIFLLGNKLFGADGYYDGRRAVMLRNQLGTVFESKSLHFDGQKALAESSASREARDTLRRFTSFEAAVDLELRNGLIH